MSTRAEAGPLSPELALYRMSPETIDQWWKEIEECLQQTSRFWAHRTTPEIIYEALMDGGVQAWGVVDAEVLQMLVFTQRVEHPKGVVLKVIYAVGTQLDKALPELIAKLEQYARDMECTSIEVVGRRGWERKLRNYGYKFRDQTLEKYVTAERVH